MIQYRLSVSPIGKAALVSACRQSQMNQGSQSDKQSVAVWSSSKSVWLDHAILLDQVDRFVC